MHVLGPTCVPPSGPPSGTAQQRRRDGDGARKGGGRAPLSRKLQFKLERIFCSICLGIYLVFVLFFTLFYNGFDPSKKHKAKTCS